MKGRYTTSTLAPSTETEAAVICTGCGALVADVAAHDKFHAQIARRLAPRLKGETRGNT